MEESEERIREVQKSGQELEKEAGEMKDRTEELGSDIDTVRQEFERRRNDPNVSGLPAEPGDGGDEGEPDGDE